ncbi:MAG: hypothetical protein H7175_28320 [Burkholderiales bacterium]|nr:hypothetical protein [Anaerolineae bacterium]
MLRRKLMAFTALTMAALSIAGCLQRVTTYCDQITVRYVAADDLLGYDFEAVRASDDVVVGMMHGSGIPGGAEFTVTIPLDQEYPEGTEFYVDGPGDDFPTDPVPCDESSDSDHAQFFEPGDDRINRQAYAYAAVYCDEENQRVGVYGIYGSGDFAGSGFPAIFVPYSELPPVPSPEEGNILIGQFGNIRGYRLTTGEYQLNVGPDFEGKEYVLVWDGCPQTYIRAAIFNTFTGETTPTEIYPR